MMKRTALLEDGTEELNIVKGGENMTIFDRIKEFDEEQMAEFLYHFARDVLNQFSNFVMPTEEGLKEFLSRERPD